MTNRQTSKFRNSAGPGRERPTILQITKCIVLFLVSVCASASFLILSILQDDHNLNELSKSKVAFAAYSPSSSSPPANYYFTGKFFERIRQFEKNIGAKVNHDVISCRRVAFGVKDTYSSNSSQDVNSVRGNFFFDEQDDTHYRYSTNMYAHPSCNLANINGNDKTAANIFIYNPSDRDRFLCGAKILIGPQKLKKVDAASAAHLRDCWGRAADLGRTTRPEMSFRWRVHSFPFMPTLENRDKFPGIIMSKSRHAYDDTFSNPSNYQSVSNYHEFQECDVKCYHDNSGGILGSKYVYGTNWLFTYSMEGEMYYKKLKIDKNAWKSNNFYATTSFQSEVPLPYYSFAEYDIQKVPAVSFSSGIKGASFLAGNCNSRSNREDIVKKFMSTKFRVDSLSKCLHNADPQPDWNMKNKKEIMEKYLFHFSFENQITDDYITEKMWGALQSGTVPVYFGAPNAKEHVPFRGVIFVNDFSSIDELANYLIKVSNDQKLYESYHEWRSEPLPQDFLYKYNISTTHSKCRYCRWAHARKYGLGWNHTQQIIEPLIMQRETCLDVITTSRVKRNALQSPAVESWWFHDGDGDDGATQLSIMSLNNKSDRISCPLSKDSVAIAQIGSENLLRSVWSDDGTTDIYLEGATSITHYLNLEFPMRNHQPLKFYNSHTCWIQDHQTRISIIFDKEGMDSITTSIEGKISFAITPGILPLRIRIVIENQDLLHEGANDIPTYFGKIMAEDVLDPPELFVSVDGPLSSTDLVIDDSHHGEKRTTSIVGKKEVLTHRHPSLEGSNALRPPKRMRMHHKHS